MGSDLRLEESGPQNSVGLNDILTFLKYIPLAENVALLFEDG